jgi:hypothetical protein
MTKLLADRVEGIVTHALDLIRKCDEPPKSLVLAVEAMGQTRLSKTVQKAYSKLVAKWGNKAEDEQLKGVRRL